MGKSLILEDQVILVDENDRPAGAMSKLEAHRKAMLHRAFSVFIFNSANELLLQKRAAHKYHSAGLWSNTCCSHPRPGEDTMNSARRRLMEEMGINTELRHAFQFRYRVAFDNGLFEHELDHVYIGKSDAIPTINKDEAEAWKYTGIEEIKREIRTHPEKFTEWFKLCINRVEEWLKKG